MVSSVTQYMKINLLNLLFISLFINNSCSTTGSSKNVEFNHVKEQYTNGKQSVRVAPRNQVEAHGSNWVVATQGKYTTQIAADVLKNGGNLIDAAVAASFAISVERPHSTGLGGGGFLIYHEAKTGKNYAFDFRGVAPLKSQKNMFLDSKGEVLFLRSLFGGLAVSTPGLVRALKDVHHRFGKSSWSSLVFPARDLARKGFTVYPSLAHAMKEKKNRLSQFPETMRVFFHPDGTPLNSGDHLAQKDLATTLNVISKNPEEFYTGTIARKIVKGIHHYDGILSLDDLKKVKTIVRKPVIANWNGFELVSMPPPSSGGIHVVQILKQLEQDDLHFQEPHTLHLLASSMQSAFADRAEYLGDPDFLKVPQSGLISSKYLAKRRSEIPDARARNAREVSHGRAWEFEEETNTTHFSMMDAEGNVVVSTQTINGYFGSGLVIEGTGIVMNNTMDDFSVKDGTPNLFGVTGGSANSIAPGKTPLSCMTPTIVFKNKIPVLALGAPGGTRIISSVAQTILNHLLFKKDLYTSIASPRIHQQWTPDVLSIERNADLGVRDEIKPETISELEKMGWKIERESAQSNVMAVSRIEKPDGSFEFVGVADPRDIGTSAGE